MNQLLRRVLSSFLVVSLFIQTAVFHPAAYAFPPGGPESTEEMGPLGQHEAQQDDALSENAEKQKQHFQESMERLNQVLQGKVRGHELDFFRLLEQEVNSQKSKLETELVFLKEKLDLYERTQIYRKKTRVAELEKEMAELREGDTTVPETATRLTQLQDQIDKLNNRGYLLRIEKELSDLLEKNSVNLEFNERISELQRQIANLKMETIAAPEITLGLSDEALRDEVIEMREQVADLKEAIKIEEKKLNERIARQIRYDRLRVQILPNGEGLQLLQNDHLIMTFHIPVHAAAIFKNYLVFIEKNSFLPQEKVQNILFVDLNYYHAALGRTEVPVFRMPIETESMVTGLSVRGDEVYLGFTGYPVEAIAAYGNVQILVANVLVNLLSPATYQGSVGLVDSFAESFDRSVGKAMDTELAMHQEEMAPQTSVLDSFKQQVQAQLSFYKDIRNKDLLPQDLMKELTATGDAEISGEAINRFRDQFMLNTRLQGKVQSIGQNVIEQRKLGARIMLLWTRLTVHRPLGMPTIKQSLAMMAGGFAKPWSAEHFQKLRQGTINLSKHPYFKFGAPVAIAAVIGGYLNPELANSILHSAFDMGQTVMNLVLGKASETAYLAHEAWSKTLAGFNPYVFAKNYLSAENLPRVAIGISAITIVLLIFLGIPNFVINMLKLGKDISNADLEKYQTRTNELTGRLPGKLGLYVEAFIERENSAKAAYLKLQADAMAKREGTLAESAKGFTPEEHLAAEEFVRQNSSAPGWITRTVEKIKKSRFIPAFLRGEKATSSNIESFGQALRHFLFSWSSMTHTARAFTVFWWGKYLMGRIFTVKFVKVGPVPVAPQLFSLFYYPQYSSIALSESAQRRVVYPTEANGGRANVFEMCRRWYVRIGHKVHQYLPISGFGLLFEVEDMALNMLEEWEKKIIPVERALQGEVLVKATNAVINYVTEEAERRKIAENGGIRSVIDDVFANKTTKSFFRVFYDKLMEDSLRKYLAELATDLVEKDELNIPEGTNVSELSARELKELTLAQGHALTIDEAKAKRIVAETMQQKDYVAETKAVAEAKVSVEKTIVQVKYDLLAAFNPKDRQINRVMTIKRLMEDPEAMRRAVTSMFTSYVYDKPLELLLTFVCLAGIEEGILKPVYPEMFGPNSWFFLSRYVFLGYLSGIATGILSEVGMKLQMDEMHEDSFGDIPEGKDTKKSFFRYAFKKFQARNNSMIANHMHSVKIIWANMPAAWVNMSIIYLITLGRLDLDAYVVGYLFSYMFPYGSFNQKIEQTFELSTGHILRNVPERLRTHPQIQDWYLKRVALARLKFNMVYRLWENVSGSMLGAFQMMDTAKLGPRSLARLLFGGYTPTELAAMTIDKIRKWFGFIPGVPFVMGVCEKYFTNNYMSFRDYMPESQRK